MKQILRSRVIQATVESAPYLARMEADCIQSLERPAGHSGKVQRRPRSGSTTRTFSPPLPRDGQELFLVFLHLADERPIAGIFVVGGPKDHFSEDGSEIDSFGGKRVNQFSPVRRVACGGDDSMNDQLLQTIGQDVCGDSFVGFQEFLVGAESSQHHVANDQERPVIAKDFHRSVERAFRAPLGPCSPFRHIHSLTHFHLHFTSKIGRLTFNLQQKFIREDC
jgi:hypothetical protein